MGGDPILIIGAGAIGSIVGVHLINAGHTVDFVEANEAHVAAVRTSGLRLSGVVEQTVHPRIMLPGELSGQYGTILLAVKARHTVDTLPMLEKALAADGCVVSLQNGLEEYKIAEAVGARRTIGACLTFGGFFVEPGHIKHGGSGSFEIGEIDGSIGPRIQTLATLLSAVQPVEVTDNIFGYLWAKIALGAVYFGTAVVDADVVDVYDRPESRKVLARLCGEVVAVADALQIDIKTSDGFDPRAFRDGGRNEDEMRASWDAQRRYWGAHDNTRTGVWRDLAVFKRPTEVDYQIKPVIELARQRGMAVPYLEALWSTVKAIEAGEKQQSFDALESIGRN